MDRPISRRRYLQGGLALGAAAGLGLAPAATPRSFPGQLGVELSVRGHPFVDAVKNTDRFSALDGGTLPLDDDGWPRADFQLVAFDYRPTFAWAPPIDDPEAYQIDVSGTYRLSFTGRADVAVADGAVTVEDLGYDAATNTSTARVVLAAGAGLAVLAFTGTRRSPSDPTGSGLTDLVMTVPGYPVGTNRTFTTPVLRAVEPFAWNRFMDVLATNGKVSFDAAGPVPLEWSERALPTDGTHPGTPPGSHDAGWAWEYVAEYTNATGKDPWINVPVAASDDYVRQLATLLRDRLRPDSTVYVEYSNELWNWGFAQYSWNAAVAERAVAAGGSVLNYDGTTDKNQWHARQVALRTAEIGQIFRDVFGSSGAHRITPILCWFVLPNNALQRTTDMLAFTADNLGPPDRHFAAIATTAYVSGDALPEGATVDEILAAIAANIPTYYPDYAELAHSHGLRYAIYEGNPDTVGVGGGIGSTTNLANRIRAARTPGMGDILTRNIRAFFAAGGDMFTCFSLSTAYNRFGTWGMTDDIAVLDRNYAYPAAARLAGRS